MKKIFLLSFNFLLLNFCFGQKLAVPYYSASQIKVYDLATNPATLLTTFNVVGPSNISYKPNCVAFYNNEMFVGYDEPTSDGFLHYKGVLISGGTLTYTSVTKVATSRVTTEIVVNQANGTLYVACGFGETKRRIIKIQRDGSGSYSGGGIFQNMPTLKNNQSYTGIGGITRNAAGDVYVTDLSDNRILKWATDNTLASPTQFLCTTAANSVACTDAFLNTDNQSAKLFSLPEGLVLDANGNLWYANNNDSYSPTPDAAGGSLVKLPSALINQNAAGGQVTITSVNATIYSKASAKFGGLARIGNFIYANDQGNGKVWKFDPSNGSFTDIGISATYPGNGQCAEVSASVFPAFTITQCGYPNFGGTIVRLGNQTSISIRVTLDIATSGNITLNASGTNFSGTITQNFANTGLQNVFMNVDYNGQGVAGTRTITVSSPSLGAGTCSFTVPVYDGLFTFGDCESSTLSGSFTQGVAATRNITIPITVTKVGTTSINLISSEFSGSLTTTLALNQTSVTIPITYTPNNPNSTGETLTFASNEAIGFYPTLPAFCYKSITLNPAASNCPELLTLPQDDPTSATISNGSRTFKAKGILATNAVTNTGTNVAYTAEKNIILSAGFKADGGAVFSAKIENCPQSQAPTMYMQGKDLYDANRQKFIIRGVNYPVMDDWGFPANDLITEIEKSGANTVRLQWYKTYGNPTRPAVSNTDLDNLLTKCKTNQMIPVLELHDLTCAEDANLINTQLISWWTDPAIVTILNKHKKYLIINLANEVGRYRWAGYSTASLNNWKNAYKAAITSIRNANLKMPIMIDSPDCGTDLRAVVDAGQELIDHDPEHNILFSVHAYWAGYNTNTDLTNAINANLPFIVGEVANKQDESVNGATSYCHYNIDGTNDAPNNPTNGFQYQNLLTTLKTNNIGWLAWAWVRDGCSARNMTNNSQAAPYGGYNTLTTFGQNIVNNATYGIKNTATRSTAF
ncbi:cellulase family glycosylhydrolase [Emticicia sp. W12TSBA100-4]|uniref:cellulase family glycosylhydrolase n=1 Tax=Emticicia sp. W12TSBA100-4 TaxID=3160965 RepID=UPI0033060AB3